MSPTELKALVFAKLIARGLTVKLNHKVRLGSVRGFKVVTLDIAALDKAKKPFIALYIGPPKERKLLKYKVSKVRFIELAHEKDMDDVLVKFIQAFIDNLY